MSTKPAVDALESKAEALRDELDRVEDALDVLTGRKTARARYGSKSRKGGIKKGRKPQGNKRKMSKEARDKISRAMKKRWADKKKAEKGG